MYFLLWLLLICLVAYGSVMPSIAPPNKWHLDKFMHFGANYAIALFPLYLCRSRWSSYCTIMAVIMFGIAIEIIQQNIPGREASVGDVLANIAGVLAAFSTVYIMKFLLKKRKNNTR